MNFHDKIREIKEKGQNTRNEIENNLLFSVFQSCSVYFTFFFLKLKFSPNQITLTGIVCVMLGSTMLMIGNDIHAGIFFILYLVIDFCDGEVARITKSQSMSGTFFDYIGDYILNIAFVLGLSISLIDSFPSIFLIFISILCVSSLIMDGTIHLMVNQVVFTEYIRINNRVENSNTKYEYETFFEKNNIQIVDNLNSKILLIFKKVISPFFRFANGNALGFMILPLAFIDFIYLKIIGIKLSFNFIEIYFLYVCFISIIKLPIKITYYLYKKKAEQAYNKFNNQDETYKSNGGLF